MRHRTTGPLQWVYRMHERILEFLEGYIWDGDDHALPHAIALARTAQVDVAALMDGLAALKTLKVDALRYALASRQIRAALGLPMHVGPICKQSPPL